jgi:hypothetical protein
MTSEKVDSPIPFAAVVLLLRFLTELALLAGLAVAGARLGGVVALSVLYAVLLPAVVAVIWGLVIAPRAKRILPDPLRFVLEFVLFAGVGVALAVTGLLVAGIVLAVVGIGLAAATRALPK